MCFSLSSYIFSFFSLDYLNLASEITIIVHPDFCMFSVEFMYLIHITADIIVLLVIYSRFQFCTEQNTYIVLLLTSVSCCLTIQSLLYD